MLEGQQELGQELWGWRVGLCPLGAWKCPIGWQIAWVGSAGPPTAPPVFLALLTPRGSWWVSVFLFFSFLSASCLLTSIAGHLVPYLLVPKHLVCSLLCSPLSSVPGLVSSASSSARVHLQHPFHLASVLPWQHLHRPAEPRPSCPAPPSPPLPSLSFPSPPLSSPLWSLGCLLFLLPSLSCPCPRVVLLV